MAFDESAERCADWRRSKFRVACEHSARGLSKRLKNKPKKESKVKKIALRVGRLWIGCFIVITSEGFGVDEGVLEDLDTIRDEVSLASGSVFGTKPPSGPHVEASLFSEHMVNKCANRLQNWVDSDVSVIADCRFESEANGGASVT